MPERFRQRHDLGVLVLALAVLAGGSLLHRHLSTPNTIVYEEHGLTLSRPGGWLSYERAENTGSPLSKPGFEKQPTRNAGIHEQFIAPHSSLRRLEIRVAPRPPYPNLGAILDVEKLSRYGEYYWTRSRGDVEIAGRRWLRTEFRYATKGRENGSPDVAEAVEYAHATNGTLFVVVIHDSPSTLARTDALIAPTLRVASQTQNTSEGRAR